MTDGKLATPQEQERAVLSGLIKFPNFIPDYGHILKSTHFNNRVHADIYSAINSVYNNGIVDFLLISERLTSLGIKSYNDLDIVEYLETLSTMTIKESSVPEYIANVIKYQFARLTDQAFDEGKKELRDNIDKSLGEIANIVDTTLRKIGSENVADVSEPIDIFSEMQSTVLSWGEEKKPTCLAIPSWPIFTSLFGGAASYGDLFVWMAPPKSFKTTVLNHMAYEVAGLPENNCIALILDSEMESFRIQARDLAAMTNVNEILLRNGKFMDNPVHKNAVFKALNSLDPYKKRVYHLYVGNKSIDEVLSLTRRFYSKHIRNGEKFLLVYDYLKVTEHSAIQNAYENYAQLGVKTDKLKKIASELPNTAVVSAVQVNRQGEVAASAMISWFCSNLFKLERKSTQEVGEHGPEFGNLKLTAILTRVQGESGSGANDYVKRLTQDGEEYIQNFINFNVENFKVTERGSALDVFSKELGQLEVEKQDEKIWI